MENTKSKLSLYLAVILLITALSVFFGASYLKKSKWDYIEKYGITTTGILYETGGNHLKFKYKVNDKEYSFGRREPYNYLQDSEEYEVKYDPKEPDYAVINFDKPILSDDYSYDETECRSIVKKTSSIRFEYEVNDEIFTRIKFYHEGESISPSSYIVKYRKDNPKIGYLKKKD